MALRIVVNRAQIGEFCRRHHVRRFAIFGSALRDDFGPESDVDVLVEFLPDHTPGLAFFEMEEELSRLFGRRVDLNTPSFLGAEIAAAVECEAEEQYVAA